MKMKYGIIAASIYPLAWIAFSLTAVHKDMEVRTEPEKYGWNVPIGFACLLIPTALIAYQGGRRDRLDENDRD